MSLVIIPASHIDAAWRDGADSLGEVTDLVEEITKDQLKMILSRGERILVRMDSDSKTVGWGTFRIEQLPNMRVLFITDLVAHNGHFETFYEELKQIAEQSGCSRIRCSALPAQARLYSIKLGFTPVYTTYEVKL